jgi:hypothetical protein
MITDSVTENFYLTHLSKCLAILLPEGQQRLCLQNVFLLDYKISEKCPKSRCLIHHCQNPSDVTPTNKFSVHFLAARCLMWHVISAFGADGHTQTQSDISEKSKHTMNQFWELLHDYERGGIGLIHISFAFMSYIFITGRTHDLSEVWPD